MAGTDGIPTRHVQEMNETSARHMNEHMMMHGRHVHDVMTGEADGERHHKERQKMHTRHESEMKDVHERHMGGEGPTGGATEKEEGKGGTEPKE